jgi:hypothetical protein
MSIAASLLINDMMQEMLLPRHYDWIGFAMMKGFSLPSHHYRLGLTKCLCQLEKGLLQLGCG